MNRAAHRPVLLAEVLEYMAPKGGETYVDATFGAGGYSRALLQAAECRVIGIDRDPTVEAHALALRSEFPERFQFLSGRFSEMPQLLAASKIEKVDGIVLDIGVSSMQLDRAERGFSFREDGPLDMRMSGTGESAADIVNTMEESALADLLYLYGEERMSRRIARRIVEQRSEAPITRTRELASLVARAVRKGKDGKDPATRTFQALRIHVNDELGELQAALDASEALLNPGGRLIVVTFHSLEDRIVKRFLGERGGEARSGSRHLPMVLTDKAPATPPFRALTRKAVAAGEAEIEGNARARSAKLRAAIRNFMNEAA